MPLCGVNSAPSGVGRDFGALGAGLVRLEGVYSAPSEVNRVATVAAGSSLEVEKIEKQQIPRLPQQIGGFVLVGPAGLEPATNGL